MRFSVRVVIQIFCSHHRSSGLVTGLRIKIKKKTKKERERESIRIKSKT